MGAEIGLQKDLSLEVAGHTLLRTWPNKTEIVFFERKPEVLWKGCLTRYFFNTRPCPADLNFLCLLQAPTKFLHFSQRINMEVFCRHIHEYMLESAFNVVSRNDSSQSDHWRPLQAQIPNCPVHVTSIKSIQKTMYHKFYNLHTFLCNFHPNLSLQNQSCAKAVQHLLELPLTRCYIARQALWCSTPVF
jgi:hypothetical protein